MAHLTTIIPSKTYATRENAIKAVEKKEFSDNLRYTILIHEDGRFFPCFLGMSAIEAGAHFHFNVIG